MSEIFLTSDLHFCHDQEFLYKPRGFNSVEEMNEAIVERWNSVVKPNDIIYNLGDMAMNDVAGAVPYLQQLNGTQIWFFGNHDTINKIQLIQDNCLRIIRAGDYHCSYATVLKYGKLTCYLSHYPTLTANYDDDRHFSQHVINFHGHVHSRTPWINPRNPFMYDVGMDSHNCTPIHIEEAISDIRNRWNEIGQLPVPMRPEDI